LYFLPLPHGHGLLRLGGTSASLQKTCRVQLTPEPSLRWRATAPPYAKSKAEASRCVLHGIEHGAVVVGVR